MYHIAMICDQKYYIPTLVTIRSLKKQCDKMQQYTIHVVVNFKNDEIIEKIKAEKDFGHVDIDIVYVSEKFDSIMTQHEYVSKSALLKFSLPQIFDQLDTILYMDGDILIRKGFENIFTYDIHDQYAAVVEDMNIDSREHPKEIGVDRYFNSGVMYLNLANLRQDNVTDKLLACKKAETSHMFMDQDCFNICFYQHVVYMKVYYNFIYQLVNIFDDNKIGQYYGLPGFDREKDAGTIPVLHLAGPDKPWNDKGNPFFVEWLSYLRDFSEYAACEKSYYDKGMQSQTSIEGKISNQEIQLEEKIQNLRSFLDYKEKQIAELDRQHEEKVREIEILKENLEEANRKIEETNRKIEELDQTLVHTNNMLRAVWNMWPIRVYRKMRGIKNDR